MPLVDDDKADHIEKPGAGGHRADKSFSGVGVPAHDTPFQVRRYGAFARANHWVTAASLIGLAISGLAMFHPSLFWMTGLFGGGQNTRALHPWIGVLLFFSFALLFIQFWRANLWKREDTVWVSKIGDVLQNREENLPELDKYNAGQKFVFWSMTLLIIGLIVTGVAIWEQYFGWLLSIPSQRLAVLAHAVLAVAAISVWIVHVYASIWVQGTMSAMVSGRVTGGWAWRHHRKWLRDLVANKKTA